MFQHSADQSQWFHLYRVKKVFPITFVLFSCGDADVGGIPAHVLDLRLISSDQSMIGGSWWVKKMGNNGKAALRSDILKFLELRAKFQIANITKRGIEEVEMTDSSDEELALAVSLDDNFRNNLEAVMPTLFSKLARNLFRDLNVNQHGLEIEEIPDWSARNGDECT